jgi:hypothetical protein
MVRVIELCGAGRELDDTTVTLDSSNKISVKDSSIGKSKLAYKVVTVTVSASATSGSSAADSDLVGGEILGVYPAGNQDAFIDNVVLNADGSVTITLAAAATADNTYKVVVLEP